MRQLPAGMQDHLDSGATTLAWCWKLARNDGVVLGFTDHDHDLMFDGVTYAAMTGFSASEISTSLGLSVDNLEAQGALQADAITERDILAGLYDDAEVEIWRVNWADVAQRILLRKGNLGEVKRGTTAFMAEIRSLAHKLNQTMGRIYQRSCDATLGDARCGIDLEQAAFKGSGAVDVVSGNRRFTATGLDAFADRWFSRGTLDWTSGANVGTRGEVKAHAKDGPIVVVELWVPAAAPIAEGDGFIIRAGCDKQFVTCKAKFDNVLRFRGFPHMPTNDFVISYPFPGDPGLDGGSNFAGS
ncbi:DUF2163 domain-containing protein [Rhodoligotrophos defluvii]|uniref:DUF2163 domain-containing protein n=1 Tax=Rhodoligotrophos defluvii TaxID=2561934 RepID=UPI0010C95F9A|nr:DUF2163 domain-containing protein [Rhodoligotrophos defluvii]